jgi:hypothetical protein
MEGNVTRDQEDYYEKLSLQGYAVVMLVAVAMLFYGFAALVFGWLS